MTITQLLQIPIVPIGPLWYLYDLLIISVISILLKKLFGEGKKVFKIVLVVTAIAYICVRLLPLINGFSESIISRSILIDIPRGYLWYLCGMLWGETVASEVKKLKNVWVLVPVYMILVNIGIGGILVEIFFAAVGIILTIAIAVKLSENKTLLYLGKNTLPIYLLHGYFIAATRVVLAKLSIPLVLGVIPTIVCGVLATGCPLVVYSFVVKKVRMFDFCFYPGRYLNKKALK